jgi:hypothetical protein
LSNTNRAALNCALISKNKQKVMLTKQNKLCK